MAHTYKAHLGLNQAQPPSLTLHLQLIDPHSSTVNFLISLADAYGCKIVLNADTALGKPQNNNQQPQTIYSCTPGSSSTQYEIHVLSVYEGSSHTRPPTAGDTPVNIVGNSNRPIILVLGSYEPVHWILNLQAGVTINHQ